MDNLDPDTIEQRMTSVPDWSQTGEAIQRTFNLGGFTEAIDFVQRVAQLAEAENHHPDILIRYAKVTLTLSTHDAGGLTDRDFDLATRIDGLATAAT